MPGCLSAFTSALRVMTDRQRVLQLQNMSWQHAFRRADRDEGDDELGAGGMGEVYEAATRA